MAKCDLSIELDDPDRVYSGGGKITGVVRVRADADVQCKGLEVRTVWKTHGRGNIASGKGDSQNVFAGAWRAGESAEYRFELRVAEWPPSYHGHFLNIDHYVEAQASIPWAFDPQASRVFLMRPRSGPDAASTSLTNQPKAVVGCVIAMFVGVFVFIFAAIAMASAVVFVVAGLVALLGGAFWLLRVWLPRFRLGEVTCTVSPDRVPPGAAVQGRLAIRPRRNVTISAVKLRFEAREQCVSGSGSNRTTHRKLFFEREEILEQATTLRAEQAYEFPFSVVLPHDAPYTVDLDDNDLIWSITVRVEMPRWPDWRQELPLTVVPIDTGVEGSAELVHQEPEPGILGSSIRGGASSTMASVGEAVLGGRESLLPETVVAREVGEAPGEIPAVTFDETAHHLWSVRENNEAAATLAEAVAGLSFRIEARIERRLLYSGSNDPNVYPDGYAVWAHYPDPPLPMVLYVPRELADDFEQVGRERWRGQGTVLGWDREHRRLQVKIHPSGASVD